MRQSILGQMVTAGPCGRCGGLGQFIEKPCPDCRGEGRRVQDKTYTVDIPAGVDTGSTLRLTGRGAAGVRGGGYGDLYVHVRVRPAPAVRRATATTWCTSCTSRSRKRCSAPTCRSTRSTARRIS